ncbi:MAG: SHOCT domain-containing protein [Gammaproteobacteria bacterium]|nr:SHOCT domain-containing protein [Gammaproteobacteria bacterium]
MGSAGAWGSGFGGIFMILIWILIILGMVALVKWLSSGSGISSQQSSKTALEILQERYARGEIEREEFEQKKRDLLE